MTGRTRRTPASRGYGLTAWGRSFVDVVEIGSDHRHITGARRYFREHHVDRSPWPSVTSSSVRGTQLDPFEVTLEFRTVDPSTVVELLRASGSVDALMALARGEQPAVLAELVAPTESSDIVSSCTCPDEAPRCIHVLATAFEVADRIDKRPVTLLRVMGADLPDLLELAQNRTSTDATGPVPEYRGRLRPSIEGPRVERPSDPYGDRTPLPPTPAFPVVDVVGDLDLAALRSALRASGVPATQVAEALDDLAELYAVLRDSAHRIDLS